jgi:proline iminopeptidase
VDFLDELSTIRCPTLVLAGVDDPVTPIGDSEDIVARIDPALVRFERFERAGHGVWVDDEARAFTVLADFIRSG